MGEFWCLQEGKGMQLLALLSLFFFFFLCSIIWSSKFPRISFWEEPKNGPWRETRYPFWTSVDSLPYWTSRLALYLRSRTLGGTLFAKLVFQRFSLQVRFDWWRFDALVWSWHVLGWAEAEGQRESSVTWDQVSWFAHLDRAWQSRALSSWRWLLLLRPILPIIVYSLHPSVATRRVASASDRCMRGCALYVRLM